MKVVHIIIGLNIGGAERMLQRIVLDAKNNNSGTQHTVISLTEIGPIGDFLKREGIVVQSLGVKSVYTSIIAFLRLVNHIRDSQCDIVQTWMYHSDLFGSLAARIAGCRSILWGVRCTHITENKVKTFVRWLCAKLSNFLPSRIICVAEEAKRVHIQLGYAEKKMIVIPNGYVFSNINFDTDSRENLRISWGLHKPNMAIGYVARFDNSKDPENFIKAASKIAEAYSNVRFLMVGLNQDRDNKKLCQWIDDTGFSDRFILLGLQSNIPEILSAMDLFCLSSRTEGFPNVVAEAMAIGLPCVATDVGDTAVLLGDTGVVVPPEDAAALAKGLIKVMKLSNEDRLAMGMRAKNRVISEYSIQKARERYEAVYYQVIKEVNA